MPLSIEQMDAAKRISDTVNLHLVAAQDLQHVYGKWCAFKLEDGRSDGVIYPTKEIAIEHQKSDPKQYCYLKITPDGISVKDAWHFLKANRHPAIDTTAPEHVVNPTIFPKFSNLTRSQKRELFRLERQNRG